jgi:hypothetical protein
MPPLPHWVFVACSSENISPVSIITPTFPIHLNTHAVLNHRRILVSFQKAKLFRKSASSEFEKYILARLRVSKAKESTLFVVLKVGTLKHESSGEAVGF